MKTKDAINYYGSRAALASALEIDRSATYHWGPDVPELRAYQLEVLTKGALVAREDQADQDMAHA